MVLNHAAYDPDSDTSFADFVSQKQKTLRDVNIFFVELEPGSGW